MLGHVSLGRSWDLQVGCQSNLSWDPDNNHAVCSIPSTRVCIVVYAMLMYRCVLHIPVRVPSASLYFALPCDLKQPATACLGELHPCLFVSVVIRAQSTCLSPRSSTGVAATEPEWLHSGHGAGPSQCLMCSWCAAGFFACYRRCLL